MDQRPAMEPSVSDIEAFLGQLAGVIAARTVVDDWGAVTAVHLLVAGERSPKMMLLETQRLLKERFGLMLDHRRISIAQKLDMPKGPKERQAILRRLQTQRDLDRSETKVVVELAITPELALYTGEAVGISHANNMTRLAAEAVLQAVNEAIPSEERFELCAQQELKLANQELILTMVRWLTQRGAEHLVGVSLIRDERVYAAVHSCLEAINRRLGALLSNHRVQPELGATDLAAFEEED